ncbi:MAG: hypothetical protein A2Z25_22220 [Planctomycetes bacterium RBG_16_55_9]|nr:MAG: hypothetical protein A2Z25_22220 [Planctomycetes bacterium RBG_16_55_9]
MGLKIGIEHTERGIVILSPIGSIDSDTCELLENQIKRVLKRSVTTLVLDMAGVVFITSRGVGAIARTKTLLAEKDGDLALMNLQSQVKKVFEIMCLVPALNVFESRDELDKYLGKVQRKITEDQTES